MAKYRKKPVVIEAFQMTFSMRFNHVQWPDWLIAAWKRSPGKNALWVDPDDPQEELLVCGTLEGVHRVTFGDFIIRGIEGEIYPCKPDIFKRTYDKVESRPTHYCDECNYESTVDAHETAICPKCNLRMSPFRIVVHK